MGNSAICCPKGDVNFPESLIEPKANKRSNALVKCRAGGGEGKSNLNILSERPNILLKL